MDHTHRSLLRFTLCVAASIFIVRSLSTPATAAEPPNPTLAVNSLDDMDRSIAEILAHPMFTPGRQPPVPLESATAQPPKAPEIQGRLAGVVIRSGIREAMIAREGDEPLIVKEGDDLDGWKVSSITLNRVIVKSGFGEHVLELTAAQIGEGPRKAGRSINKRAALAKKRTQVPMQSQSAPQGPNLQRHLRHSS